MTLPIPSALRMAYAEDLAKLRRMARHRNEHEAVEELEALLQANKMPDQHLMSIFWGMIRRNQKVDRYGK